MHNLDNLRCYLAGPIEHLGVGFKSHFNHEKLKKFMQYKGVLIIDPRKLIMNEESEIKNRDHLLDTGDWEGMAKEMKVIVRKDLRSVDLSDFIIAYLPYKVQTCGTYHEIINASLQKKPTLLVCPEGIKFIPKWLFGFIPTRYLFGSLDGLLKYLTTIDITNTTDNRWQFIIKAVHEINKNTI